MGTLLPPQDEAQRKTGCIKSPSCPYKNAFPDCFALTSPQPLVPEPHHQHGLKVARISQDVENDRPQGSRNKEAPEVDSTVQGAWERHSAEVRCGGEGGRHCPAGKVSRLTQKAGRSAVSAVESRPRRGPPACVG